MFHFGWGVSLGHKAEVLSLRYEFGKEFNKYFLIGKL